MNFDQAFEELLRNWEGRFHLPSFERCHLEKIEHDGRILFSIKYLWWLARYAY